MIFVNTSVESIVSRLLSAKSGPNFCRWLPSSMNSDLTEAGYVGACMDILLDNGHRTFDFLSEAGFLLEAETALCDEGYLQAATSVSSLIYARSALQAVRCCKRGALHVIAICCNSFCLPYLDSMLLYMCVRHPSVLFYVMINCLQLRCAGTHGRGLLFPLGNQGYHFVREGNLLASRVCILILVICSQGCRFVLEQPQGSFLEHHPRMSWLFTFLQLVRASFWGGAFAASPECASGKRHIL